MTEPSNVPEQYRQYVVPATERAPAHHRPPNVLYDDRGRPVHFTIGQPPPPLIVQAPVQQGMDPATFRLVVVTFLILAVVVVCTACACAVVVLMGGTLLGIIGAVSANAPFIGVALVGVILAAGWAASKIRPVVKRKND
ncbi:hypothetical protein [Streptomyces shenzhenensis]|uniref:hypothetical protein n=1 Tax=Streptomyces shenzhenensis TaxID=943815 RepID=UPI001F2F2123|nr:hypothetical protein [Streptomyces shenzhenensis]